MPDLLRRGGRLQPDPLLMGLSVEKDMVDDVRLLYEERGGHGTESEWRRDPALTQNVCVFPIGR